MPPNNAGKTSQKVGETHKKETDSSQKDAETLSAEKIEAAELRAKIKDLHSQNI